MTTGRINQVASVVAGNAGPRPPPLPVGGGGGSKGPEWLAGGAPAPPPAPPPLPRGGGGGPETARSRHRPARAGAQEPHTEWVPAPRRGPDSPFLDLGRNNFGVCLVSRRSVRNTASHWVDWHPSRPHRSAGASGSHGLGFGTDTSDAPRGASAETRLRAKRPSRSRGPSLVVRQAVRYCQSLVWAGLTPAQPGAALLAFGHGIASRDRSLSSLQVRRHRVVTDGRPSRGLSPFSTTAPVGLRNLAVAALLPMG